MGNRNSKVVSNITPYSPVPFNKVYKLKSTGFKMVLVGNEATGKSSVMKAMIDKEVPSEIYVPTVFDNMEYNLEVEGEDTHITMWDTAGQHEYHRLRPLSYPGTDVFALCFSVVDRESFDNISKEWLPEVRKYNPLTKCVLLGLKTDLRTCKESIKKLKKQKHEPVSDDEGIQLAEQINAIGYLECSSATGEGVENMLYEIGKFFNSIATHQDDMSFIQNYQITYSNYAKAKSAYK